MRRDETTIRLALCSFSSFSPSSYFSSLFHPRSHLLSFHLVHCVLQTQSLVISNPVLALFYALLWRPFSLSLSFCSFFSLLLLRSSSYVGYAVTSVLTGTLPFPFFTVGLTSNIACACVAFITSWVTCFLD